MICNKNLLIISIILTFACSAIGTPATINSPVTKIYYTLNGELIDEAEILAELDRKTSIDIGEPLSRYDVRKSCEAIYSTGEFAQVEVVESRSGNSTVLFFNLSSKTKIHKIELVGNHGISDKSIFSVMSFRLGSEFSEQIIEKDRRRIIELYKNHGYFHAKVNIISIERSIDRNVELRCEIDEGNQAIISSIGFEGNASISTRALRAILRSKVGKAYVAQEVKNDIENLLKHYRKIGFMKCKIAESLNYNDLNKTLLLVFTVLEGEKIIVKFSGRGVKSKELMRELELFRHGDYSDYVLKSSIAQIEKFYKKKGYYAPSVEYSIDKKGKEVFIHFELELGSSPRIGSIRFVGNEAFDDSALTAQMKVRAKSNFSLPGLSWLFSKGIFDPVLFERDRKVLELFYKRNGYVDISIVAEDRVIDAKNIELLITIVEGKQQKISDLVFTGNTVFNDAKLSSEISARTGIAYSSELTVQDELHLRALYDREGYIYADIEPIYDSSTGQLNYKIFEGVQVKLGKLVFQGNSRTNPKVLRREFERVGLRESEVLSFDRLIEAKRELFQLGLFETIKVDAPGRSERNEFLDVAVVVEESEFRAISISGGYSPSEEGIRGTVGLTHNNLFGRNLRSGLRVRIGTKGNLYEAKLIEPWLIGRTMGTFRVFEDNLEEQRTNTRTKGATANLSRKIGRNANLMFQYKYHEIMPLGSEITNVSSVGLSFHRDTRDHFLDPRNGSLHEFAIEYAGGVVGGETSFIRITTDHRMFKQVENVITFATALRLGYEEGLRFNRQNEIVSYERFRVGGSTTVRGYELYSLGPKDDEGNHSGDLMFLLNVELRLDLYRSLRAVLFSDFGNVWNNFSEIRENPPYSAIGVGVRGNTPLGPIRLDYGFPLSGAGDGRFYLELGHPF